MTQADLPDLLAGWAPEPTQVTQTVPAEPAMALAGLFDTEPPVTGPGDPLPPLWHWLYFLDRPAQHDLGSDGHNAASRFAPPIPQPRRMFAGGRVRYDCPIRCGDEITRRGELAGWKIRQGAPASCCSSPSGPRSPGRARRSPSRNRTSSTAAARPPDPPRPPRPPAPARPHARGRGR